MGKNASPTWEFLVFSSLVIHETGKIRFAKTFLPAAPSFIWHSDPVGARYTAIEHVATVLGFVVGAGFEPARHKKKLILFATSQYSGGLIGSFSPTSLQHRIFQPIKFFYIISLSHCFRKMRFLL